MIDDGFRFRVINLFEYVFNDCEEFLDRSFVELLLEHFLL